MRLRVGVVVGSLGMFAACTADDPYQSGYRVGCFNGQVYAGKPNPTIEADRGLYPSNPHYTKGLNDGVSRCYQEAMRFPLAYGGSGGGR